MTTDYYQQKINSIDKEIADLEKKKAIEDKKAADEQVKAAKINIGKNAPLSSIKQKIQQKERYESNSRNALEKSAQIQKKIAQKRLERNRSYQKLQSAQQNENFEEKQNQQRLIADIKSTYEKRIADLEKNINEKILVIPNNENSLPEYDVFVSHASEDKEDFVDEFVSEMRKLGIKVWYDTTQIKWGDSLRQKIDEGLSKSKFGIAVLSPNYIADGKYWTKEELDGIFQMESINGKSLLPIWHNLTKKQVTEFSPIIANKKAMTTASMTAKEIAEEMANLLEEK